MVVPSGRAGTRGVEHEPPDVAARRVRRAAIASGKRWLRSASEYAPALRIAAPRARRRRLGIVASSLSSSITSTWSTPCERRCSTSVDDVLLVPDADHGCLRTIARMAMPARARAITCDAAMRRLSQGGGARHVHARARWRARAGGPDGRRTGGRPLAETATSGRRGLQSTDVTVRSRVRACLVECSRSPQIAISIPSSRRRMPRERTAAPPHACPARGCPGAADAALRRGRSRRTT